MEDLVQSEREWAYANGLVVNIEPENGVQTVVHAPYTLEPSPVPRGCFEEAYELSVPYNELYGAVANDKDFLRRVMREAAETDEFVRRQLALLDKVEEWEVKYGERRQWIECALLRSDYMFHYEGEEESATTTTRPQLKQVEINTISASFAGLSSRVSRMHRHMAKKTSGGGGGQHQQQHVLLLQQLPENNADIEVAHVMAEAKKAFEMQQQQQQQQQEDEDSVVLYVVQSRERNKYDQLHVQQELMERYGVRSVRRTLHEVWHGDCHVDDEGHVRVAGQRVAVVYYRSGYGPGDYGPAGDEWKAREKLELSRAIKIPTIGWQLAGSKKVQQVLANVDELKRFFPEHKWETDLARVKRSFAGLYEVNDLSIAEALAHPERYVLKPQREGGGNNMYGEEMASFLRKQMTRDMWPAYILMELIVSRSSENRVARNNVLESGQCVSELGVYSGLLRDTKKNVVLLNKPLGHLLRTKLSHVNESGVSAGFGALDSPKLI